MTQPAALTAERARFNTQVAPRLVAQALPGAAPSKGSGSSRFAFFETPDALAIVSGEQEGDDAGLALAYGLTLAKGRRLVLVLPEAGSFATLQRAPFLKKAAQPELWHHDVPQGGDDGQAVPAPARNRQDAVDALTARLKPGQTLEDELADAFTPKHLGAARSSAVVALVEWATTHPLLDPGHRRGERSWHCMGQKVLSIRASTGKGLSIRAGIHFTKPGEAPAPLELKAGTAPTADEVAAVQQQVEIGIALRLKEKADFHKPDEHWLQAVIRRAPELVGVEQPALRELPAWRPAGADGDWGRGYVDLAGLDGSGDLRLVETKLTKNKDDLLIFQGLDYYVWAQAYADALRVRLGAARAAEIVVHYVIGAAPPKDDLHISAYAPAQAAALDIPWRCQVVTSWFASPQPPVGGAASKLLEPGELP